MTSPDKMQEQKVDSRQALAGLFDYAGLFPPAGLTMQETVTNFRQYQKSTRAWMLNTIVVPASRLEELADVANSLGGNTPPVKLSVLSSDWDQAQPLVEQFRSQHSQLASIVSVETRQLDAAAKIASEVDHVYIEIPCSEDVASGIAAIKQAGVSAKIRTGGLTADAFPSSQQVAEFVVACCQSDVSFKATAGLHHPLAKVRPTCSDADAPLAPMHGFANLLAAVAMAEQRSSLSEIQGVLSLAEEEATAMFSRPEFWRDAQAIRSRFHSIGSCSIDEPVDDLLELGWL